MPIESRQPEQNVKWDLLKITPSWILFVYQPTSIKWININASIIRMSGYEVSIDDRESLTLRPHVSADWRYLEALYRLRSKREGLGEPASLEGEKSPIELKIIWELLEMCVGKEYGMTWNDYIWSQYILTSKEPLQSETIRVRISKMAITNAHCCTLYANVYNVTVLVMAMAKSLAFLSGGWKVTSMVHQHWQLQQSKLLWRLPMQQWRYLVLPMNSRMAEGRESEVHQPLPSLKSWIHVVLLSSAVSPGNWMQLVALHHWNPAKNSM